jgi:hypothetical protein
MAEQSKFAGALARLKQPAAAEPPLEEPAVQERLATPMPVAVTAGGGKGRPPTGKRSNPEWDRYTVLLRKVTHKRALRRLQDMDTDQDLSELLNEVLTEWLERRVYFHTYGNPEIQTTRRQPGNRLCLFDLSA